MRAAATLVLSSLVALASGCSSQPRPEKPPEEAPVEKEPEVKKKPPEEESGPAKPPPPKKPTAPPPAVTEAEMLKAKSAYVRGDLEAVAKALPGISRPERGDMPELERSARLLVRRTKLLLDLVTGIPKSPLAAGKGIEDVEITARGHVVGLVGWKGDKIRVQSFGVDVETAEDDIARRVRLSQEEYEAVARSRLAERVARVKPDDALGHFRCAYYAWTYGIAKDAMPHLDGVLSSDDFPIVAQVFARKKAPELVSEWCRVTGHAPPAPRATPPRDPAPAPTPAERPAPQETPPTPAERPAPDPSQPSAVASPSSNNPPDPARLKKARDLFEGGMAKYKASFGEGNDQDRALREAKQLLENARDQIEQATNGHDTTDEAEDLRSQIQSLLFDVRKRSRI